MKLSKRLKDRKGFISIESVFAITLVLMIMLVIVGFFTLMYPRIMIQTETHNLVQKAKIQGGLTDATSQPIQSDVEQFKDRLVSFGYKREEIEVLAYTSPGKTSALGVTPLHDSGSNYIKRDSKEMIQVVVRVPANNDIKAPLSFFGIRPDLADKYTIAESIMSERW